MYWKDLVRPFSLQYEVCLKNSETFYIFDIVNIFYTDFLAGILHFNTTDAVFIAY